MTLASTYAGGVTIVQLFCCQFTQNLSDYLQLFCCLCEEFVFLPVLCSRRPIFTMVLSNKIDGPYECTTGLLFAVSSGLTVPSGALPLQLWSEVDLRGGIRSLMASRPLASAKEVICGVEPKPFKAEIRNINFRQHLSVHCCCTRRKFSLTTAYSILASG